MEKPDPDSPQTARQMSEAILAYAAKDRALAAILLHLHDCIESLKGRVHDLIAGMPEQIEDSVNAALDKRAERVVERKRAWWDVVLKVTGAVAAVVAAITGMIAAGVSIAHFLRP